MTFRLPTIIAGLFVAALILGAAFLRHPGDAAASLAPLSPKAALTATPPPPRCPGERFTDVCPGDYFYRHVLDLIDLGILSGYSTVPPCDGPAHIPCFKPYNWTTRGQIAKVVSMAAGFNEPVSAQTFEDVPPGHTFYEYIERLSSRAIVSGYPCGTPNLPCGPGNKPYFLPGNTVSRGQLSKVVVVAFGFNEPVSSQTFQDVPSGSTFHEYIERLANRGIISGYPCGGPGEPCLPPGDRPYFRPANPISRGQVAKIVNLARTNTTPTPAPTDTPTGTPISTQTPTAFPTITGTSTHTPTGTGTPTVTNTPTSTGTPSATDTPTATPTCCTDITGSISASCQPTPYEVTYTTTNNCTITLIANIASIFEVSPNASGPWQTVYVGDCFSCPVPPGTTQHTETVFSGPLPAGNNYWRYSRGYYGAYCRWSLSLTTDPQPACVLGTATPFAQPR